MSGAKHRAWVIRANDAIEGLVIGNEEDAAKITQVMKNQHVAQLRKERGMQDGEFMPYHIYWRSAEVSIVTMEDLEAKGG